MVRARDIRASLGHVDATRITAVALCRVCPWRAVTGTRDQARRQLAEHLLSWHGMRGTH